METRCVRRAPGQRRRNAPPLATVTTGTRPFGWFHRVRQRPDSIPPDPLGGHTKGKGEVLEDSRYRHRWGYRRSCTRADACRSIGRAAGPRHSWGQELRQPDERLPGPVRPAVRLFGPGQSRSRAVPFGTGAQGVRPSILRRRSLVLVGRAALRFRVRPFQYLIDRAWTPSRSTSAKDRVGVVPRGPCPMSLLHRFLRQCGRSVRTASTAPCAFAGSTAPDSSNRSVTCTPAVHRSAPRPSARALGRPRPALPPPGAGSWPPSRPGGSAHPRCPRRSDRSAVLVPCQQVTLAPEADLLRTAQVKPRARRSSPHRVRKRTGSPQEVRNIRPPGHISTCLHRPRQPNIIAGQRAYSPAHTTVGYPR